MDRDEFIDQQIRTGSRLHAHDGVWWEQHGFLYCKPALPYEAVWPKRCRPDRTRSFVGYSHAVPTGAPSNAIWSVMSLEWENDRSFALDDVHPYKRNRVRKAFAGTEIAKISDIRRYLHDLQEINISTSIRRGPIGRPTEYYVQHFEEWKRQILELFDLGNRAWWGAFVDGRLIAYMYGYSIEQLMIIATAKSHSDFLSYSPNDGLVFRMVEDAVNNKGCRTVIFGDWVESDQNLNHFKERFGFRRHDIPVYIRTVLPQKLLRRIRSAIRR